MLLGLVVSLECVKAWERGAEILFTLQGSGKLVTGSALTAGKNVGGLPSKLRERTVLENDRLGRGGRKIWDSDF